MASIELQRLWKLASIDSQIADIRKRAANLDVGQRIQTEIDALTAEEAKVGGPARALQQEQTDLELAQQGLEAKLKRMDSELYGGKIVNPKEVEAYEREIASLKRQRSVNDDRLLALLQELPPAQAAAQEVKGRIEERRAALAARRKAALAEKTGLEEAYRALTAQRPEAAKASISPTLLARYEAIRQKHGGIGMVEVDVRRRTCGGCGTTLPERSIQTLKDDKAATCESCHRLLYYTEGLV